MIQKLANDKDFFQNLSNRTQNNEKMLVANYLINFETFVLCKFVYFL